MRKWLETNAQEEGRKLFGIVQGGRFLDLRRRSAEELQEIFSQDLDFYWQVHGNQSYFSAWSRPENYSMIF